MKIGIVTFQNAENYGAALQCKALYTYLAASGNVVEIIDYRCPAIENAYRIFPKFRKNIFILARQYIGSIKNYRGLTQRKRKFQKFLADFEKTLPMGAVEICKTDFDYDLIIAGSDQVWNPNITGGFDKVYFLDFNGRFRRAGYAISLGNVNYPQFADQQFSDLIKEFDNLSFREPDAADFISSKLRKKCPQVVDPTLLLSREQWDYIIKDTIFSTPTKYILVYYVIEGKSSEEIIRIAEHLSEAYSMPILNIKMGRGSSRFHKKINDLIDVGPYEFIYLVKNASMVATSSFHGTALSCIYQKNLSVVIPEIRGSRVSAIADMFHLKDRVYSSYEDFIERCNDEKPPINNSTSEYQEALKRSVNYLHEIIGFDKH